MDHLTEAILTAHQLPGDQFEWWAFCNLLSVPKKLEAVAEASLAPRHKPARIYTEAEERLLNGRIAQLEQAIVAEKRRRRALLLLKAQYTRRLPSAEAAVEALEDVAHALASARDGSGVLPGGGSAADLKPEEVGLASLPAFMAAAEQLRSLIDTLREVTPETLAAAQQAQAQGGGTGERDGGAPFGALGSDGASSNSSSAASRGGAGLSSDILDAYERDKAAVIAGGGVAAGAYGNPAVLEAARRALSAAGRPTIIASGGGGGGAHARPGPSMAATAALLGRAAAQGQGGGVKSSSAGSNAAGADAPSSSSGSSSTSLTSGEAASSVASSLASLLGQSRLGPAPGPS